MSDNVNFSEMSNGEIKKNKRISLRALVSIYLGLWAASLIVFWLWIEKTMLAAEYCLIDFYIIMPIATFVVSLIIGKNNYWGKWKWVSSIVFGIMCMLLVYFTINTGYMISQSKIIMPFVEWFYGGGIISLIGLAIGTLIGRIRKK